MAGTHDQPVLPGNTDGHDDTLRAWRTAVADAVHAPSIFNTQPWRWTIDTAGLTLHGDDTRRLAVADPDGSLLVLSCGTALHHARVSLAAQGWVVEIDRLPGGGDLVLARIRVRGRIEPDPAAVALRACIARRRTDRRPFADAQVPALVVAGLTAAAQREGTRLHRVRRDQVPMLAVAVAAAQSSQLASPAYRIELIRWTNRPEWSNDGVPPQTGVRRAPRRVAVRDFAPPSATFAGNRSVVAPELGMPVAPGGDRGATYLVLHGPGRQTLDWLRAGEALSAVSLAAVDAGLAVSPFSDVLEVDHPRDLVRGLLPGRSHPYILVRCGYAGDSGQPPSAPRRGIDEILRPEVPGIAWVPGLATGGGP
jgi:hypothetical protein